MNANAPAFSPRQTSDEEPHTRKKGKQPTSTSSKKPGKKQSPPSHRPDNRPRPPRHPAAAPSSSTFSQRFQPSSSSSSTVEMPAETLVDKRGRVSLNHLLSFSFPARQAPPVYTPRRTKTSYQPYNKERFVNANFRFVTRPTGNYLVNTIDADSSFDWDDIEQVLISGEETPSCPICLSPPSAARVTKCGHIFCYGCILHYLELREPKKQWRKCPICWEAIYGRDLKSVRHIHPFAVTRPMKKDARITESSEPSETANLPIHVTEGDCIDLILIQRSSQSTLALPCSSTWPIEDALKQRHDATAFLPWHFTPDAMLFGRFMLATPEYLLLENDRDIDEMKEALKDAKEWGAVDDVPYLEAALKQLVLEAGDITQLCTNDVLNDNIDSAKLLLEAQKENRHPHGLPSSLSRQRPSNSSTTVASTDKNHDHFLGQAPSSPAPVLAEEIPEAYQHYQRQQAGMNTHHHNENDSAVGADALPTAALHIVPSKPQLTTSYLFYQAKDGQHLYLHPLDTRILKYEYGDYQHFPDQLQVKCTAVEETTMTEDVRKRFKFISHLPVSCDVTFIEVDIAQLVSKSTLAHFDHELKLRQKKRRDLKKKEERARKVASMKEEQRQKSMMQQHQQLQQQVSGRPAADPVPTNASIENDPFFRIYQPMTPEDNDRLLKEALDLSANEARANAPRTVWGTPAIANDAAGPTPANWADHIVVTQNRRKNRSKRK
ncbi:hypothetical protein DM01DRAFT_1317189 [Hesseltinella vesiculosa]|uniref:RING-type domain-containing protein n=1 Tax=Hesseltinella vesiculosa TaxID=101127 RepID=A0A1X2GT43_9FUNG|nr:hypothetical protein DM01DRAFT_1317189 [Hesseltinella vesiculosa]